jgi:bifunctional non-homologous end joining protein LigD
LLPATVEAMAFKLVPPLPSGPEWLYELKWDGYRAIGQKTPNGTSLFSRLHKDFADTFRDVHHALSAMRCDSAVVDGEIVALVGFPGSGSTMAMHDPAGKPVGLLKIRRART